RSATDPGGGQFGYRTGELGRNRFEVRRLRHPVLTARLRRRRVVVVVSAVIELRASLTVPVRRVGDRSVATEPEVPVPGLNSGHQTADDRIVSQHGATTPGHT